MKYLSLAALKVALSDLFTTRHATLLSSGAGKTYETVLAQNKARIDALPEALTGGKPLADVLSDADARHDGFGAAIFYICEAYERWPNVPADIRAAIGRIRAAFVPELDELKASYADEVNAAINHKASLAQLEDDLKRVPIAGGLSLHDWCVDFVGSGEALGALLSQRADMGTGARKDAAKIRTSTLAVLGRFRGALCDEVSVNQALPRDLEAKVFGLFDELSAMREAALASRPKDLAKPDVEGTGKPKAGPV